MIRQRRSRCQPFRFLLALLIALSGAHGLRAQVVSEAANAAVSRVTGAFDATPSAPAPSPLNGPSVFSLNAGFAASLAVPATAVPMSAVPTLAPAAAAMQPAAAKPVATAAAAPIDARPAAAEEGLSSHAVAVLRQARRAAHALAEPVPGAPDALAGAPTTPEPGRTYTPSPEDWRDEIVHFLLLDRFARAGKSRPVGDPKEGGSRHGGNLRGAIERLDYLKNSGVTTLMLSPVAQNQPETYHGYAPVHLMAVDPHLGTMDDLKELVREAHKRDMRVVLDWVLNHSGPVFEYKEGGRWRGMDGKPKEIGEWTATLKPVELADAEHFTRRGVIDDWNDHEQAVNGDFPPNYRHYASDKPATRDILLHVAQWWIKETDIDGFRLDAVRHIAPGFLPIFSKRVKEYAAALGKKNFFVVGENSTGVDADLLPHLTKDGLDSAFNYPAYRRENHALHGKAPTRALEDSLRRTGRTLGAMAGSLLRFIDNHDVYRFLRLGEPEARLRVALAYLLFSIGIPMTYYGTEQGLRQDVDRLDPEGPEHPADPRNREDMFKGGRFKSESSNGDKFDENSPTYLFLRKLAEVRRAHAALRRGEQWVRWSDPNEPGVYAFSRIHQGREVVVAMNFSLHERAADMWVDRGATPAATTLVDALDLGYRSVAYAEETGSKIRVVMPPLSARVLVRAAQ